MVGRLVRFVREPELIGPPECPIMRRWTLRNRKNDKGRRKVFVHHFLPNADERDVHDHPWAFWTLVLRGGYTDVSPDTGEDYMGPGSIRRRPALHRHRTRASAKGAWTIVITEGLERKWGFWRGGRWWPWREYEAEFGEGMRCDND